MTVPCPRCGIEMGYETNGIDGTVLEPRMLYCSTCGSLFGLARYDSRLRHVADQVERETLLRLLEEAFVELDNDLLMSVRMTIGRVKTFLELSPDGD
jgi:hypothetical protein